MTTRFAMAWPAAAKPYPGEVAHEPAPSHVPDQRPVRAGTHGCIGQRADGEACNANAGTDGRCARHKARP